MIDITSEIMAIHKRELMRKDALIDRLTEEFNKKILIKEAKIRSLRQQRGELK